MQHRRLNHETFTLAAIDDVIETGIRQLIRDEPLETTRIDTPGGRLTVPTLFEILRIKAVLILRRNAHF